MEKFWRLPDSNSGLPIYFEIDRRAFADKCFFQVVDCGSHDVSPLLFAL
jgi:hypothetical protein